MPGYQYCLFDTAFGRCAIAWGDHGVRAASFPEDCDDKTVARMTPAAPNAIAGSPSGKIQDAICGVQTLLETGDADLSQTPIDDRQLNGFDKSVLSLTSEIAPGITRTYGELAKTLGDIRLSQRVGQALGRNPIPIIIPCHRVIGADGRMTGFSAPGGAELKRRLLKREGALAPDLFDL